MIKKIVIPAAGRGMRMKHLSRKKPKHLIEVKGKPFLYYLLENIKKSGFKEIIIVIGYKNEISEKFIKKYDPQITVLNQSEILGNEYGTACPIKCVENIIGRENFLSASGDNLYSVADLEQMKIDDEYNYVAGLMHDRPEEHGVLISDDDDYLEKIIEKSQEFSGNLVNTGLYKFTPAIFEAVKNINLSPRGEYEITDAISLLARDKKVKIKKIKNHWLEFTRPEDIIQVSNFLNHHS